MKSKWKEAEAKKYLQIYRRYGEDLALRTYTARLIGKEPSLVLHGGGNTSVKTLQKDITGKKVEVLCVKGSGWDLASIEPEGHPAVKIAPLLQLKNLKSLGDADMVNSQRINMLDSKAPNPSVETLLHAFLPHKFIDHSHSDAILSLINHPKGELSAKDLAKGRLGIVPYVMPGFDLARLAEKLYLEDPKVEGLILLKHGLFTFGDTAKQSYERMIYWVNQAERYLQAKKKPVWSPPIFKVKPSYQMISEVANHLRGALWVEKKKDRHLDKKDKMIIRFRTSAHILAFASAKEAKKLSQVGPPTPDHVIRTKQYPLYLPLTSVRNFDNLSQIINKEVSLYKNRYEAYVKKNSQQKKIKVTPLDSLPRIIIVPGLGLFSAAADVKAAEIALDIYEHTIDVIEKASYLGDYQVLSEADLFDMEYWSLEQAKLGRQSPPPLHRQILWISGAASGIGLATAKAFYKKGVNVFMTDINEKALKKCSEFFPNKSVHLAKCDVTKEKEVQNSFDLCSKIFGGVDVVVSNAGNAPAAAIEHCSDKTLRDSFDINFFSHQHVAKAASAVFKRQGLGGVLLFNASKSAFNQGPGFGPYATPKAALITLMKQYAIEMGQYGVRSNAINADRILTGLFEGGLLEKRAKARSLSVQDYLSGNLLKEEVYDSDVAQGFVYLAMARKTTGTVLTVDGGNASAFPR